MREYGKDVVKSNVVGNCGYDAERAEAEIKEGLVKAVSFGQAFIPNPDYYRRLEERLPLGQVDAPVSRVAMAPIRREGGCCQLTAKPDALPN